jgi:radical SAM superfamily enzyme YgiQ (UPF0313 family)
MKTAIVALYPYQARGLDAWLDHGAGMTYTAVQGAGVAVDFVDMKGLRNDKELSNRLCGYDLVAFGLKSSYYPIAMRVIRIARALGCRVLVGGYHATAAPHELLDDPSIDWVLRGESEITFPKFLVNPGEFPRDIWGEKPPDLDALPFMRRDMYHSPLEPVTGWWYGGRHHQMVSVVSARGCPYGCAFCQPLEFNHFGPKVRRRSVGSVVAELLELKQKYSPDSVLIHDDTFLIEPAWLEEFVQEYPRVGLPFWAAGRADGICKHPDLVRRLVGVGWDLISVGFESGSQQILDIMEKGTTVEQNLESARIIKACGAKIYANYILGLPWETRQDVQATMRMADAIAAEMPSWAYFAPYPGCGLGDRCIREGLSLLDCNTYDRYPGGVKCRGVDYAYLNAAMKGLRE